jgi:hypothetical protein
MPEQTITAAVVISFCEALEDGSARFYEELARQFPEQGEAFLGFAKDCARNKLTVVRTYQETITDAIETGYSFAGLSLGDPMFGLKLEPGLSRAQALATATKLEEQAVAFYVDVADRSQALLATIPGAFRRVAKVRGNRKRALEAL